MSNKIYYEKVTPKMAEEMLTRNKSNRPLNQGTVLKYSRQMMAGEWKKTPEAICFDIRGYLLNGQHRLNAIVKSGVTVEMLLSYGNDPEIFDVLDTGKMRSADDVLAISGFSQTKNLASGVREIMLYNAGRHSSFSKAYTPSNSEILKWAKRNMDITTDALKARELYKRGDKVLSPGFVTGFMWMFRRSNPDKVEDFFEKLMTGVGISEANDPIYVFRKKLISAKNNKYEIVNPSFRRKMIIEIWNRYLRGKKIKFVRVNNIDFAPIKNYPPQGIKGEK